MPSSNSPVGPPYQLEFIQQPPTQVSVGQTISPAPEIGIFDSAGNLVTTADDQIYIQPLLPNAPYLQGTTTVDAVNGIAEFTGLSVGQPWANYQLVAYDQTEGIFSAESNPFDVVGGSTISTLTSSPNPSTLDQNVVLIDTIAYAAGYGGPIPTGPVTFEYGGTILGTANLNGVAGNDQATITTNALPAGQDDLQALYPGDTYYLPSTASTVQQVNESLAVSAASIAPVEGESFAGTIGTISGGTGPYSVTINWGDGTPAQTMTVASRTITGSHVYAEEGNYPISLGVTDSAGQSSSAAGSALVADALLSATGASITFVPGASFTATVASFTDADPNGAVSDYTAVINWGDNSSSAGTIEAQGNEFIVVGQHTYAQSGSHPIIVAIMDQGGAQTQAQGNAAPAAPPNVAPGNGLIGLYYNNTTPFISGQAQDIRVDPQVAFAWRNGNGNVVNLTPNDPVKIGGAKQENFSVVWEGWVSPATTGFYTFDVEAAGAERLYVDNQLLIDRKFNNVLGFPLADTEADKAIQLMANQKYPIFVEYHDPSLGAVNDASVVLNWAATAAANGGAVVVKHEVVPETVKLQGGKVHTVFSHDALGKITFNPQTLGDFLNLTKAAGGEGSEKKAYAFLEAQFGLTKQQVDKERKANHLVRAVQNKDTKIITANFADWVLFAPSVSLGSIIQQVSVTTTVTPVDGKPQTETKGLVEGWTIKDGKASAIDTHARMAPLALNPATTKSIQVVITAKVGLGLFEGLLITGMRKGATDSVPGIFDQWVGGDPKNITWLGQVSEYKVVFTINANGTWTLKDESTGVTDNGMAKVQ